MRFYNREKELASLEKVRGVSFSVHSQMTVLTGRRRIGKTSLIFKSCENTPTVYLFVSRSNETALCLRFVSEIRQALNIYVPELTNFAEVFRFLMDLGTRMAYNLVIDEFQEFYYINQEIYSLMQDGTLQNGSKLPTERTIAETLGIGRNSTREALSILHGMGMIERVQGSGNYISKNAGESIRQMLMMMLALGSITKSEVCEFRCTMEKSVCSMLIEKGIPFECQVLLEDNLARMEQADGSELVSVDKEFHELLIRATENELFSMIMEAVMIVYREWIDLVLRRVNTKEKANLLNYHKQIYNSVLERDEAAMKAAVDGHYHLISQMLAL